jgi:hypothetical protein
MRTFYLKFLRERGTFWHMLLVRFIATAATRVHTKTAQKSIIDRHFYGR